MVRFHIDPAPQLLVKGLGPSHLIPPAQYIARISTPEIHDFSGGAAGEEPSCMSDYAVWSRRVVVGGRRVEGGFGPARVRFLDPGA